MQVLTADNNFFIIIKDHNKAGTIIDSYHLFHELGLGIPKSINKKVNLFTFQDKCFLELSDITGEHDFREIISSTDFNLTQDNTLSVRFDLTKLLIAINNYDEFLTSSLFWESF